MSGLAGADIIKRIADVLEQRKSAGAGESYSASLYRKGDDAILAKIAEEAGELIEAADGAAGDVAGEEQRRRILHEMADLWFHCQVLLAHKNITVEELLAELEQRFGTSGHEEKRRRGG